MNICDKIPLYLYNEMNGQEKLDFENHLKNCSECSNSCKVFKAVQDKEKLTSAPLQTINAIFEKTTRKKSFSFANLANTWKFTFALAACLVIGVCVFSLKEFTQKENKTAYYADSAIEEIERINYELDEMEKYFMV